MDTRCLMSSGSKLARSSKLEPSFFAEEYMGRCPHTMMWDVTVRSTAARSAASHVRWADPGLTSLSVLSMTTCRDPMSKE